MQNDERINVVDELLLFVILPPCSVRQQIWAVSCVFTAGKYEYRQWSKILSIFFFVMVFIKWAKSHMKLLSLHASKTKSIEYF